MSYCLNPDCPRPENLDGMKFCQSCGARLLLSDRYGAVRLLGQGGFGRTFLALDDYKPSRPACVIKQFCPQGMVNRAKAIELFHLEAVRLEVLGNHPQIPGLLAHCEQENQQYLVQEFIDGPNLSQELAEQGVFREEQIRSLLTDLLPVLRFIHQGQVIHRDIKPENIIRRRTPSPGSSRTTGNLVLVDFGAAKFATATALEKTGTKIGSAGYSAPEQAYGKASFASDLYSLGITCIHLLTQADPFDLFDADEHAVRWRHRLVTPISEPLARILDKLVQSAMKLRYQSAEEVLKHLQTGAIELEGAQQWCDRGTLLAEAQRYEDAIAAYRKALQLKPDYAEAWYRQAAALGYLQRYQEAVVACDRAIQLQPESYEAWYRRGAALGCLQRYQEAIAACDQAIQLKPDCYEAWFNRSIALDCLQRHGEAVHSCDRTLFLKPDCVETWITKGTALRHLQRYTEAISALHQATQRQPDAHEAWYELGLTLREEQRFSEALAAFERAGQCQPQLPEIWYQRGLVLKDLHRYESALKAFDEAIRLQPDYHEAWYSRGPVLGKLKRYSEALVSFDRAIALQPDSIEDWIDRGTALCHLQRYEEALTAYNQAIQLNPHLPEAWYARGYPLHALKRYEEALASYNRAIQLRPDFERAITARDQTLLQLRQIALNEVKQILE